MVVVGLIFIFCTIHVILNSIAMFTRAHHCPYPELNNSKLQIKILCAFLHATWFSHAILACIIIELFHCCESLFDVNKLLELRIGILDSLCSNNTLNIMKQVHVPLASYSGNPGLKLWHTVQVS
jgi:hypothetical protein